MLQTPLRLGTPYLTVILAAAWILLWLFAGLQEYAPHASSWFPPAALSFAAFCVFGLRAIGGVLIGIAVTSVIANIQYNTQLSAGDLLVSILFSWVAHALIYWLVAYVVREIMLEVRHSPAYIVLSFLALSVAATAGVAYVGVEALIATEAVFDFMRADMFLPRWLGDLVAVIVFSPLCIFLLSGFQTDLSREFKSFLALNNGSSRWVKAFKVLLTTLCLVGLLLLSSHLQSFEASFLLLALLFPMLWVASSESFLFVASLIAGLGIVQILLSHALNMAEFQAVYSTVFAVIAGATWLAASLSSPLPNPLPEKQ